MTDMNRRDAMLLLGLGAAVACSPRASGLGPQEMNVSRIGLGTWQTFDVGSSSSARKPLEGDIAAKLELHPKLFMATKVWTTGQRAGIEQMEDSMLKLV